MLKMLKFFPSLFVLLSVLLALSVTGCGKMSSMTMDELLNNAADCADSGNWAQAVKFAKYASERDPTNTAALVLLAITYEYNSKADLALEAAKNAVKTAPDDFIAQYTLGRLYAHDQNRLQDSIEPLMRAYKLRPDDIDTLILLAECSLKLGLPKTPEYYKRLLMMPKFNKRSDLWNQLGVHYAEKGKTRDAFECFITANSISPDNPVICLNLAIYLDRYVKGKGSAKSIGYYQRFVELSSKNPELESRRQEIKNRIKEISGK
jgi:cytochrome c-type biogenesis protein CcmH/NrfG